MDKTSRFPLALLGSVAAMALLSGCGNKGPLVRPQVAGEAPPASTTAAVSPPASTTAPVAPPASTTAPVMPEPKPLPPPPVDDGGGAG